VIILKVFENEPFVSIKMIFMTPVKLMLFLILQKQ